MSTNTNNDQKITLVGAGLAGSLLAVLLAKRGFQVEIYELRPDMRREDISAGRSINLALANRGIYPLEKAGLMDEVKKILIPMKGRMIHDIEGNQSFQSYGQRAEEVIYSVSRGDLNKICMTAAEQTGKVKIHFESSCEKVDLDNNLLTIKNTETGETFQRPFNRIIGSDGATSPLRTAIHDKESQQLDMLGLGHSYKELCIPAGPNGEFLIDKNSLHIWPHGGYMVIALPNMDGSFTVTLFMPNEGEISFDKIDTPEKVTAFFKEKFNDAYQLMPSLIEDYFENPTGFLGTIKCAPWHYQDKALILGDAAHAIVPFHGQGMNCAFEDTIYLAETIDRLNKGNTSEDWKNVFADVDSARKANGDAIADMAIDNYIIMRDSVRDEKFILSNQLAFELENRFPEYFCPRYSMVMFHRLPYAEAFSRGKIQLKILQQLVRDVDTVDAVDFELAEKLIKEKLEKVELNPA